MTTLDYSSLYPMAPLGGLFIGVIGIFVVLGGLLAKQRMVLVYIGFAIGTLAIIFGGRFTRGLSHPSTFQVASLVAAIAFEIAAFRFLMPRLRLSGARASVGGTLGIVGAHFLIMEPAFGPVVAALGILCLINAAIAWRSPSYPLGAAWAIDGILKIACGCGLLMTSPAL